MDFELRNLDDLVTVEELASYRTELADYLTALDLEKAGQVMSDAERAEFQEVGQAIEAVDKKSRELKARKALIERLGANPENTESEDRSLEQFHTRKPGTPTEERDIYDLSTIKVSMLEPEVAARELRDRAMRAVETSQFPHPHANREQCQSHVAKLLDTIDGAADGKTPSELARRILATGSPAYRRAFTKYLKGQPQSNEEARSLALGTGASGGFAIVYQLDPTIIPTSNGAVNPWRAISSVEQIAGTNEWRGVTAGGITASRVAELTEASDNAPTLAQPALIVTKVHTFVPFSIELGQDWGSLQSEMARLIQDAKDVEESAAFATGDGNTPNPQGIITGASNTVTAGGTASFAVADVYKVFEALPARFRPRATWVANLFTYDKIRQFDTAGGASLFVPNLQLGFSNQGMPSSGGGQSGAANLGYALLQRPAYESSDMASALTTGTKIAVVGDFSYYKIVDRIGMDVEVIPHLFGSTNRMPIGQRGLYAYWRNYAKVLSASAFRVLVTG
jgi:HK97 family phage major capsid protein